MHSLRENGDHYSLMKNGQQCFCKTPQTHLLCWKCTLILIDVRPTVCMHNIHKGIQSMFPCAPDGFRHIYKLIDCCLIKSTVSYRFLFLVYLSTLNSKVKHVLHYTTDMGHFDAKIMLFWILLWNIKDKKCWCPPKPPLPTVPFFFWSSQVYRVQC